jgi:DNA-binding NarL/FixJ family response regulator
VERTPHSEYCSGDALFVVDEDLRISAWNAPAERLTGIRARAAIGEPCWSVLAGRDAAGSVVCRAGCAVARAALRWGDVTSQPMTIRTAHGLRSVVASTISTGENGARQLVHLLRPVPAETDGPAAARDAAQLTPREREVLELLAGGQGAAEIAVALGISMPTVRTHIQHILSTLGVHSQLAAVARGCQADRHKTDASA